MPLQTFSSRAGASTLVLVIGVVCVGFLLALPLFKVVSKSGTLSPQDAVDSTMQDLVFHVNSLSAVDAGVHHYNALAKVDVAVVTPVLITVSQGDYSNSFVVYSQRFELVPGTVSSQKFCIVKSTVGGVSKVSICDGGDEVCCTPTLG